MYWCRKMFQIHCYVEKLQNYGAEYLVGKQFMWTINTDHVTICVYTHIHSHIIPLVILKLPGRIPKKMLTVANSGIILSIL